LIANAQIQLAEDLVLTYSNANETWDKLIRMYEQSRNQRLSLLMTDFFKLQRDSQMDIAAYVARVETQFPDMNTALRRRFSHNILIELQHE